MKHISTRQLALCAVLTALALGLSTLENLFPVTLLIPLPGVKLGLANIVTVFALYQLGALPALAILTARCLLGGLFAGNASAMLFSLLGGLTAMLVMILLRRLRCLSIYGVSIGGAHHAGQHRRTGLPSLPAGHLPADGNPHGLRLLSAVPGHGPYQTLGKGVIDNG